MNANDPQNTTTLPRCPDHAHSAISLEAHISALCVTHLNFEIPRVLTDPGSRKLILSEPEHILGGIRKDVAWSMSSLNAQCRKDVNSETLEELSVPKDRLALFLLNMQRAGYVRPIVAIVGRHKGGDMLPKMSGMPIMVLAQWRNRDAEPVRTLACRHSKAENEHVQLRPEGWHLFSTEHDTSPQDHAFPPDARIVHFEPSYLTAEQKRSLNLPEDEVLTPRRLC